MAVFFIIRLLMIRFYPSRSEPALTRFADAARRFAARLENVGNESPGCNAARDGSGLSPASP